VDDRLDDDYCIFIFDEEWLLTQPPEYQRSIWNGRAETRIQFARQATTSRERQMHLNVAGEYERHAFAATAGRKELELLEDSI